MSETQKAIIKLVALFILCGCLVSIHEAKPHDDELEIQVEEICSVMVSSYTADVNIYEKYHGSENEEERSWAEQAKMRANKTASTYNNFILENSFVWEDNVPDEVAEKLDYIY